MKKQNRVGLCVLFKSSKERMSSSSSVPIAIIVTVEIKEDRVDDFLVAIEADAIGSRAKKMVVVFGLMFFATRIVRIRLHSMKCTWTRRRLNFTATLHTSSFGLTSKPVVG